MRTCSIFGIGMILLMGEGPLAPLPATGEEFRPILGDERLTAGESLKASWAGYRSEVTTAEIDYKSITFSCDSQPVSKEAFCEFVRALDWTDRPGLGEELLARFCPERLVGPESEVIARIQAIEDLRTFRLRGDQRRSISQIHEHIVTGDLHLLVEPGNKDIKAYMRGTCPYWLQTMDWFRPIPHEVLVSAESTLTDASGMMRLHYAASPDKSGGWAELDSGDGLPRYWEITSPDTNSIRRVEFYLNYTVYPGGVLCPAVRLQANLKEGRVTLVQMTLIRNARFNIDLDDVDFRLSAPAGWAWFDWRTSDHRAGTWEKSVTDVAQFFLARSPNRMQDLPVVSSGGFFSGWKSLLLIFNGSLLIALGVALWRRSP